VRRDEVCTLGKAVDDTYNCVVAMGFRHVDYKIYTDYLPWCVGGWSSLIGCRCCTFVRLHRSQVLTYVPM
jgi:hypothetical protein